MEKDYAQLVVWAGTTLGEASKEDFVKFIMDKLGCRAKFAEEVVTLPDKDADGYDVDGTGGRHDLFFYIHNEDLGKFAIPRFQFGMRWWEDVLLNGGGSIYSQEILDRYPFTWDRDYDYENDDYDDDDED